MSDRWSEEATTYPAWSEWCQRKSPNANEFKSWLADQNIFVDWKTANRWFRGHSEPGTDRLKNFAENGLGEVLEVIFGPYILAGDMSQRRNRIAELRHDIERLEREICELEKIQ